MVFYRTKGWFRAALFWLVIGTCTAKLALMSGHGHHYAQAVAWWVATAVLGWLSFRVMRNAMRIWWGGIRLMYGRGDL